MGAFVLSMSAYAWDQIPLTLNYDYEMPIGNGHSKGPENLPVVYIEDYTLAFTVGHPEYLLSIKDENDVVVYTTTVYSTDTQVVLPSTLSGDYKIELVMGNWLFTGYINLS